MKTRTAAAFAAALCAAAVGCADLQLASRRALFDASQATPQTQEAYKRAEKAIAEINAEDERAIGEAVALRIVAGTNGKDGKLAGLVLGDKELQSYVSMVGNLVALHGHRIILGERKSPRVRARRFVFAILDTDDVGAYSTPGGYVFVTRGTLARLQSESELAWVLGHEIAHVDHEDGLAALKASLGTNVFEGSLVDSLKGQPASESPFKNQKFFNGAVDSLASVYQGSGLARDVELRADHDGLACAVEAGYDGDGANRALDHLDLGTSVGGFLTHGSAGERRSAMQDAITRPGKTGAGRYDRFATARIERLTALAANGGGGGAGAGAGNGASPNATATPAGGAQ